MKILVFLGTVRDSSPPNPPRLGLRVAQACIQHFGKHHPDVTVELIDPLQVELKCVFKPHFSYRQKDVPPALDTLAKLIEGAEGYVMISPEYNHSMSPALANLLNHFGSSLYSHKPSAIVTYSAGQWGGTRAAVNMRTFLSELGCLPVSSMIHVPKAAEVFTEDGSFLESVDEVRWAGYLDRTLQDMLWWASAARTQRAVIDPRAQIKAFKSDPSQRNAP